MKSSGNNLLPSLNDYFKVVIPFQSKFYKKANKYSYSGKAYLIFENNGKLVFNTAQLNEDDKIIGANNYKDNYQSENYLGAKSLKEIKKLRLEVFGHNQIDGKIYPRSKKGTSKLKIDVKSINNKILEKRLTIKNVCGFIEGSNSSGGLTNPSNDPIRAIMNNPFKEYDSSSKIWNVFSLFSALYKIGRNDKFNPDDEINLNLLNQIEEKSFEYLINLNLNVSPYGKKIVDYYVSFEEAFLNHNIKNYDFPFEFLLDLSIVQESFEFNKKSSRDYLIELVNKIKNEKDEYHKNPRMYLNRQLRTMWLKEIKKNIKINHFSCDFVNNVKQKDQAHILENKKMLDSLMSFNYTDDELSNKLDLFFNENNYLLLPKDIHKEWDDKKISIDHNGNIINNGLSNDDYQKLILIGHNIYSVYKKVKNKDRLLLLSQRN